MKKALLLLTLISCCGRTYSQEQRIKKVEQDIKQHLQADTLRVNRLVELLNLTMLPVAKADSMANQALSISRKLRYHEGEIKAELTLARVTYHKNNLPQALAMVEQAIALAEKNTDKKFLAQAYRTMSTLSNLTGESKKALEYNKLADEYLRLAYHGLRAKDKSFNSELATTFGGSIPEIYAVPQDIGRMLLNLFTNAFYATQQKKNNGAADYKPIVEVSTSVKGQFICIKVKDNGMGIPDSIKEKIMQPFFTTKPTGEGTGLGLSMSYDIVVKGHGGKIEIDSKENDHTELMVLLPLS